MRAVPLQCALMVSTNDVRDDKDLKIGVEYIIGATSSLNAREAACGHVSGGYRVGIEFSTVLTTSKGMSAPIPAHFLSDVLPYLSRKLEKTLPLASLFF